MVYTTAVKRQRLKIIFAVVVLVAAMLLPSLGKNSQVEAAQILNRYIDMDSSASSAETTYNVSFQLPNGVTIGSFRVEFCNVDPLPGLDCSTGIIESDNVPDMGDDAGSAISLANFALADAPGDTTNNGDTCTAGSLVQNHATSEDLNYVDVACNATEATVVTETGPGTATDEEYVNFDIVNINNPSNTTSGSNNDTFYVRLYVFAGTSPTAYNQASPPLGVYEGGLAMSTANQITVTARVQEQLTFRVGADSTATPCDTFTDTTVDLGVLNSTVINLSSTHPAGGDLDTACTEVTTNASNGVGVYYIGDNLKVTGEVCGTTDTENATPSTTDKCLNRDPDGSDADNNTFSASPDITAGTEQWGLSVLSDALENAASNETTNLSLVTKYDGNNGTTANNNWTFVPNTAELFCSSTTVVNAEVCRIDMAGTAAITTPTGLYTTTLTFIATATF